MTLINKDPDVLRPRQWLCFFAISLILELGKGKDN